MNGCARQASRAQGRVSGTWYLYLIRAADSRLYTGITTDVERRLSEHRSGGARGAKALRGMAPLGLVYCREFPDRIQASRAEYRIKQLPKLQKERLVSGDLDFEAVFAGD